MTAVASSCVQDLEIAGLVDQIYGALLAPQLWPLWIDQLADRLGGCIRLHEPTPVSSGLTDAFEGLVRGPGEALDLQDDAFLDARWTAETEFAPQGPAASAHRDLSRSGFVHALALQTTVGGREHTLLTFHRRATSGGIPPRQWDLLEQLAPHLARAVHLRALLDRAATAGQAASLALDMAHTGLAVVDADRRIVLTSKLVERACESGALSCKTGSFDAADLENTPLVQQAIASATRISRPKASTFSLQGDAARYNFVVAPLSPANGLSPEGRALVLLSSSPSVTREDLQREYGLTPSEAALLCALFNGQRLAEYARSAGLQLSTIKTHLRGIFMKTGERRQADLIRRVLSDMVVGEPRIRA